MRHRGKLHRQHNPINAKNKENDAEELSRKRPTVDCPSSPSKKAALHFPRQRPRSPDNHILKALFNSTNTPAPGAVVDLTMSPTGSDTDSFHDALTIDSWTGSPHSSQGSSKSSPPTQSPVPAASNIKNKAVSSTSASIRREAKRAPAWALFREEQGTDGTPERIFLPLHHPNIKIEPSELEIDAEANDSGFEIVSPPSGPNDSLEAQAASSSFTVLTTTDESRVPEVPIPSLSSSTVAYSSKPMPPFLVVELHMRVSAMLPKSPGKHSVPWATQFYLASLASFGLLSLDELKIDTGVNALRSKSNVTSLSALFDPSNQQSLWESTTLGGPAMSRRITDRERQMCAELDREKQMLSESPINGVIGPQGAETKSFGGRVLFEGRISCAKNEKPQQSATGRKHREFYVQLLPPKLGGSCRFSRRFGSESILRLKIDQVMAKDARRFAVHNKTREIHQEILYFFTQPLKILGRVYRPFISKDDTIFYLWIESPKGSPDQPEFDCVWDFIDHHAPFAENLNAPLGKFIQRVPLGLSTSVPTSIVDDIDYVPDVLGDPDPVTGKREVMSDGAGIMSLAVAQDIAQHLGYASVPSAFQGRIAGSKGVWYLDPAAQRWVPGQQPIRSVAIRDSQKKICYPDNKPLDLSQHVVDLLNPTRTFSPSTLSKQIILVLHSNGVPISTFADLQRAELCAIKDDIVNWDGPDTHVCLRLATVVERLCKVESMKAKRSTEAAEHRAQGMDPLAGKDNTGEDGFDYDRSIFFGQDGRHIWNGKPLSKHECAYEMLLVGFHPKSCSYLADLLIDIASQAMKKVIGRFAIPIKRSAEAMVIPDPTGTLEEGEIQFRFSGGNIFDPDTKLGLEHVPEGDVLVTRHPCLLPTDVRKVKAVVRPELSMYQDVVVFSVKGRTPLASILSGGDYDGDLIRVFWEPSLVEPFRDADVRYAQAPFKIDDVFDQSKQSVGEFVAAQQGKDKVARDTALIERLVAGVFDPAMQGLYGMMHLYAAWQFGVHSAEAVELAHKFCQCMDAAKTGLVIKPQVRIADSKKYLAGLPEWAYDQQDDGLQYDWVSTKDYHVIPTAVTNASRPESVLCALWAEGKVEVGQLKKQMHEMAAKLRGAEDKAISSLWRDALKHGRIRYDEQAAIQSHCKIMEKTYIRTNAQTRQTIENKNRGVREGKSPTKPGVKGDALQSKAVPLRRVRSEANPALSTRDLNGEASVHAVDDLDGGDRPERLDEALEVPAILGSASEVAMRFCQWPRSIADQIARMDRMEVFRLEALRASYAYSITYSSRPKFAFEMAWRWIMHLKAEAAGSGGQVQGLGSLTMPISTLDLLGLRKKIITRNFESTQGNRTEP